MEHWIDDGRVDEEAPRVGVRRARSGADVNSVGVDVTMNLSCGEEYLLVFCRARKRCKRIDSDGLNCCSHTFDSIVNRHQEFFWIFKVFDLERRPASGV